MEEDKKRFAQATDAREVNFVLAEQDVTVFKEQVKNSDVVYVRGGSSEMAIEAFKPLTFDFTTLMDGKIYAGSSAGVMFLSHNTRSHTGDWKKGLGILPFNSVVHWSEDLRESLESFQETKLDNDYEMLLIPETEFIVKEI